MVRTEAQKKAQLKYRQNPEKYEKVKSINARSNKKRYAEDEEFREKMKARQRELYLIKKEKKLKEKEELEKKMKAEEEEAKSEEVENEENI